MGVCKNAKILYVIVIVSSPLGPPLVFKTQTHCENPLSKEFWKRIGEREGERRKKGIGGIGEGPPSTMLGGWFPKTVRRW